MNKESIGCCGAYCGTCQVMEQNMCKGCKLGYQNGERDLSKAKCKIKICCINNKYITCADCSRYNKCEIIQNFHNKNGYKYKKYKEAIEFIINNDYEKKFK